jgi:TusA-related sulfurtransferase
MKEVVINGRKITVASTVDAIGLFCPIPIVNLKLELEQLRPNQIVEVLADDPGFEEDLKTLCTATNNKLLSFTKNEENIFTAYVEKT